mmetsp:Transcript_22960/g.42208  ORF Transcript_22960/g.42208 Transcript_22960/m.42208 type:complete len:161 (+) Transcript_22960:54-536(+)
MATQALSQIADVEKRSDAKWILGMMKRLTGHPVKYSNTLWTCGGHELLYRRDGKKVTVPELALASRKGNLTMHMCFDRPLRERIAELPKPLGKVTYGVGCLHMKRLSDVDKKMLEQLCKGTVTSIRAWAAKSAYKAAVKHVGDRGKVKKSVLKKPASKRT